MGETNERYHIQPERFWLTCQAGALDGYATMGQARLRGWEPVAIWGRSGWDVGRWPYQVIYHRDRLGGFYLATCVDGDVDVWRFPTRELRDAATDQIAFLYWKEEKQPWLEGVAHADEMPEHLRGSYLPARFNAIELQQEAELE